MGLAEILFKKLDEICHEDDSSKKIIIFRGVTPDFVLALRNRDDSLCGQVKKYIRDDGSIDVNQLNNSASELLTVLSSSQGVILGLFEEFILLRNVISILRVPVFVADNNLFDKGYYPACLSKADAELLSNYYKDEFVKQASNPVVVAAGQIYSDVIKIDDNHYKLSYLGDIKELEYDIKIKNVFNPLEYTVSNAASFDLLDFAGTFFEQKIISLLEGCKDSVSVVVPQSLTAVSDQNKKIQVFVSALNAFGIRYDVVVADAFEWDRKEEEIPEVLELFHRHWGEDKEFRNLKFYENAINSKKLVDVSQSVIVNQIINQSLQAFKGESYRNMFITAPTGAGKSLLFQLPAVYLARKEKILTIVVSPLISLMKDQVSHLKSQNILEATYLNSELSTNDREDRLSQIESGRFSIIYMSPEMLLNSGQVSSIIESRGVGLVVIDEAHTVTTWGKDFRSDYWFLGEYLRKLRVSGQRFPIVGLTATAVYGGNEDTVYQTFEELCIDNPLVYFGNTRRDNISFDIKVRNKADFGHGSLDDVKIDIATGRIGDFIAGNHKSLVYCPYASQTGEINEAVSKCPSIPNGACWTYNGRMDKEQKEISLNHFKKAKNATLVCTKAFSMGVDIKGIDTVYHYAPTGGLADYVQEIGRAGRSKDAQAKACIDFFPQDIRYTKTLNALNNVTLYQLKEIMSKLIDMYDASNRRRNLLVAPESFTYLFGDDKDIDAQFKKAMLILSEDFRNRFGYPVLVVRPKATYTKNFVCVPPDCEEEFKLNYGSYVNRVSMPETHILPSRSSRYESVLVSDMGSIYEIDMAALWERQFPEMTFPNFKRSFFEGELFGLGNSKIVPRKKLTIRYKYTFDETLEKYEKALTAIDSVFTYYKSSGKSFTKKDFVKAFSEKYDEASEDKDVIKGLVDFFVTSEKYNGDNTHIKDRISFVFKRTNSTSPEAQYLITKNTYVSPSRVLLKEIQQCSPNKGNEFISYPPVKSTKHARQELRAASLLQLLGLATYEVIGGENLQVFVRINNPQIIRNCIRDKHYKNLVLQDLNERKNRAIQVMKSFFMTPLSDNERWNLIEDYFLGNDQQVNYVLGIEDNS